MVSLFMLSGQHHLMGFSGERLSTRLVSAILRAQVWAPRCLEGTGPALPDQHAAWRPVSPTVTAEPLVAVESPAPLASAPGCCMRAGNLGAPTPVI